jgi:hypothetical protein
MLPAIYFIFSRRGCDKAVEEMGELSLVNEQEAAELKVRIDEFLSRNPDAGRAGQVEPLYRGIAAHHAGILPAWKGFVEELFQLGLVKVVFATETLAAGINMPARTTVISTLSKRTDRGHRLLTASEFLQMAGRAGRRGMDATGYVVTLQTPFEGAKEAAYLATAGADPLVSQFTPNYGMVLNLLQTHSITEAKELVERSFAQYLATLYLRPQQQAITELTTELTKLDIQLAPVDVKQLSSYEKLSERLKEERRLLKTLQTQAEETRAGEIAHFIQYVNPGTILYLKGKYVQVSSPVPSVLVTKEKGRGQSPYLLCLSADNRWYVATTADVVGLYGEIVETQNFASLQPPEELVLKPGQVRRGTEETEAIASSIPPTVELTVAPEVLAQQQVVDAVKAQLDAHPVRQLGNPSNLLKRHRRRLALQEEINERQAQYRENQAHHWQEFLNLIEILRAFGCLEEVKPTLLGQAAAAIRGDNELWIGLALMSGAPRRPQDRQRHRARHLREPRRRLLLSPFVGAIAGPSVARGSSFLKDKLGEQVFASSITVVDDPHRLRGLGSAPFDDEGVANRRDELVRGGVITTWLLNTSSARQLGLETTGHASRGLAGPPGVSPSNLHVDPGELDLAADARSGLGPARHLDVRPSLNANTGDWSAGVSGTWFENGEAAYPVTEITVAGNLLDIYARLTPGADLEFRGATNAPSLMVESLAVAGR